MRTRYVAVLALSCGLALAGCSGGTTPSAGGKTTSTSSSSPVTAAAANSTTEPPSDLATQTNCRQMEVTYSTVLLAIKSNVIDSAVAGLVPQPQPALAPSSSVAGTTANSALAQLEFQGALMRYNYATSMPLDRAAFLTAWKAAANACLAVGYHFTIS